MATIPLFFDQFKNAKGVEHQGYGIVIKWDKLNFQYLQKKLLTVLNNPKYVLIL